jgi:hypothetical protein
MLRGGRPIFPGGWREVSMKRKLEEHRQKMDGGEEGEKGLTAGK